MMKNNFVAVAAFVFLVVGLGHAWRFFSGWEVMLGGFTLPMWASAVASLVALYLSFQGYRLSKRA